MFVLAEVSDLEKDVDERNFNFEEKIANIRSFLFNSDEDEDQLSSKEAIKIAVRIWDIAIKLKKFIPVVNDSDKSKLVFSILPDIKILATDIFQKYCDQNNENDLHKLFCLYSYTFETLLAADNISLASNYLDMAFDTFHKIQPSSDIKQILAQLIIWQAKYIILHDKNYDEALSILKEFTSQYMIESSRLLSFVYKKTVENKSIEWCDYCLSLAYSYPALSNEAKNQIESLLAQLYLNNDEPEKALEIISNLPHSISKLFIEIKCIILLSPKKECLKEKLISFIPQSCEDHRILVTLCLFVADHCDTIGKVAIEFIKEVMKMSCMISNNDLRNCIYLSAIQISCEQDDIDCTSSFMKIINGTKNAQNEDHQTIITFETNSSSNDFKREIAAILWEKAFDTFETNEFECAVQWMQFSRSQMSDIDNLAQSSCFRFISCCFFEAKKYKEALMFANDIIQRSPSCWHGHFLKFQTLLALGNEKEAFNAIDTLLKNSSDLEEFEPDFFFSVSSDLHSVGNCKLALEVLLKFYEQKFNQKNYLSTDIKKLTINSLFSLLQEIENDDIYMSSAISRIYSRWEDNLDYKVVEIGEEENEKNDSLLIFTPDVIYSYASIVFNNGVALKNSNMLEKAANSFIFGAILSDSLIELRINCILEATDCCLKIARPNSSQDPKIAKIQKVFEEIDQSDALDQKEKDKFYLARVKMSVLLIITQNAKNDEDELPEIESLIGQLIVLISFVKSAEILYEICSLICQYKISYEAIQALLERAKVIDQALNENSDKDEVVRSSISASILYQLYKSSTTVEDVHRCYDTVLDFLKQDGNSSLMSTCHLQFFMSRAWDLGAKCVESLQLDEAGCWFQKAIEIMEMKEELNHLYCDQLSEAYSQFLIFQENRSKLLLE